MARKIVYATRRERFNAAHKLWNNAWDAEKNVSTFGKCSNPNWHGHNFDLYVTIKGEPHPDTGYCMDLKALRDIVSKFVTDKVDHRNLNLDVDFMSGIIPSCSNFAIAIWEKLEGSVEHSGGF